MFKFWMVYRFDGGPGYNPTPTKKHDTLQEATEEAERLCRETKGTFIVLEAIKKCQMTDVEWSDIQEYDGLAENKEEYDKAYDAAMEDIEKRK